MENFFELKNSLCSFNAAHTALCEGKTPMQYANLSG